MSLYLATYSDAALAFLRIVFAATLLVHGWPKLRDMKKTAVDFEQMGFRPGALFGGMAAFLETFGGLMLLVGALTQAVAFVVALQFVVILGWRILKRHRFVGGWELDLLMLGVAILFLSMGAGDYSIDAVFLSGLLGF